jgi:hypothetical protein
MRRLSLAAIAVLTLGVSISSTAQTYTFSTLYAFQNNGSDPKTPSALIINDSGTLFGTSLYGGVPPQLEMERAFVR